jgi:superfamily II DNA or RNA helicase
VRVDSSKPFVLIYSLHPDSELGAIIEPFVVQLNDNGSLSLSYQKVYPATMDTYNNAIDRTDQAVIKLCAEYTPEVLTKKFSKKELKPQDFFSRVVDEKMMKTLIRPYIEERMDRILVLLNGSKKIYIRAKSTNPAQTPVNISEDEISVRFHFNKDEEGTKYYPTFRHRAEKLVILNKKVALLTQQPCRILMNETIYNFDSSLDGKKLIPFFTKWNIHIPKASEAQYYKKFIKPLIENHDVIANGFKVIVINDTPIPVLRFEIAWNHEPVLQLLFDYGMEKITANDTKLNYVKLEQSGDNYTYYKIKRSPEKEKDFQQRLERIGLIKSDGAFYKPVDPANPIVLTIPSLIEWVANNRTNLESAGFKVIQDAGTQKYYFGMPVLDLKVQEQNDWFDVFAMVYFGEIKIPFLSLRKYILSNTREFPLPDGRIAILPDSWFSMYKDLLLLASEQEDESLKVKKHHFNIIANVVQGAPAEIKAVANLKEALETYKDLEVEIPENFKSILRPYQQEGFRWMRFLKSNNFGGCLADDMGLGKTVQALALLQSSQHYDNLAEIPVSIGDIGQLSFFNKHEANDKGKVPPPSLIVMPTSLIHNWEIEVKKFTPGLKVVTYTGLDRAEKLRHFKNANIILSTYGTVRNDIEMLKDHHFNYIVLDESQVIKNPQSKISLAVKRLSAGHRLSLTGTPIENSLTDLWSQMNFLNPGMLGTFQLFKDEFVIPIEKKNDPERKKNLRNLIQPFLLRRTKEEVAPELPALTEKIYYSEMTAVQKQLYDDTRNYYRKRILENIEKMGESKSQFFILKGLMQLRLIANHPRMQDAAFEGESGKFTDIINTLAEVIENGHKVLVFSQFVRHLELLKAHLIKNNVPYSLLTGQTQHRSEAIAGFKNDENIRVFLISLKAGGVGLNLTEADYIFLCDPWWNPAAELQAMSRAHRIGQDKKVFSYKFISRDTVEEKILKLQERKLRLSADFISPELSASQLISKSDVEELFS